MMTGDQGGLLFGSMIQSLRFVYFTDWLCGIRSFWQVVRWVGGGCVGSGTCNGGGFENRSIIGLLCFYLRKMNREAKEGSLSFL